MLTRRNEQYHRVGVGRLKSLLHAQFANASSCPSAAPGAFVVCDAPGLACWYGLTTCTYMTLPVCSGAPRPPDPDAHPVWSCASREPGCPESPPSGACTSEDLRCPYSFGGCAGMTASCRNGTWDAAVYGPPPSTPAHAQMTPATSTTSVEPVPEVTNTAADVADLPSEVPIPRHVRARVDRISRAHTRARASRRREGRARRKCADARLDLVPPTPRSSSRSARVASTRTADAKGTSPVHAAGFRAHGPPRTSRRRHASRPIPNGRCSTRRIFAWESRPRLSWTTGPH